MPKKAKKPEYHFLVRVIQNTVTPEERKLFEDWLSQSDKHRKEFDSLVSLWNRVGPSKIISPPDLSSQWDTISSLVHSASGDNNVTDKAETTKQPVFELHSRIASSAGRFFFDWRTAVAATILIVIAAAYVVPKFGYRLRNSSVPTHSSTTFTSLEILTKNGEKKFVVLPDGSKIHLNTSSRITFPDDVDGSGRSVELEGEAYLSITPNKNRPFRVKCGNTVTVVRGTEFNVKNRGQFVSVVVVKGSVDTYNLSSFEKCNLKKGEMVSYGDVTGMAQRRKADLRHFLAWRDDKFSFSRTPLKEVMAEIERYYNVKVIFKEDSLKEKTITGYFNTDSMTNILAVISVTLDISISSKGGIVRIDTH